MQVKNYNQKPSFGANLIPDQPGPAVAGGLGARLWRLCNWQTGLQYRGPVNTVPLP